MKLKEIVAKYPDHISMTNACIITNINMCKVRKLITIGVLKPIIIDKIGKRYYLFSPKDIDTLKKYKKKFIRIDGWID